MCVCVCVNCALAPWQVRRLVKSLQNEDGSFRAHRDGESDMRFLYCACAVSRLCSLLQHERRVASRGGRSAGQQTALQTALAQWSDVKVEFDFDVDKAVGYLLSSQSYEGAFGLCPGAKLTRHWLDMCS